VFYQTSHLVTLATVANMRNGREISVSENTVIVHLNRVSPMHTVSGGVV
jgi:hypothetical protein